MTEYERGFIDGIKSKVSAELTPTLINVSRTMLEMLKPVLSTALENDLNDNNAIPAADVQPVKHGEWEETHISLVKYIPEDEKEEGHSFYMAELKCSCCERYNTVTFALTLNKPDFCQHCGARMDLKGGDAE